MQTRALARGSLLLLVAGLSLGAFSLTFTHLAGSAGGPGSDDGSASVARFASDSGVVGDAFGNVYVADTANHTIRKILQTGEVYTLAGLAESAGSNDGRGARARFNSPVGIALSSSGLLYVADTNNHTIRKIWPNGTTATLAGTAGAPGNVDSSTTNARFRYPQGVAVDPSGNVYVADTGNNTIRMISTTGTVSTLAGTGSPGNSNGTGTAASFNGPSGIAYDATSSSLFVGDVVNHVVRQITLPGAVVSTFAGTMGVSSWGGGMPGYFRDPRGVSVDGSGNVYVSDSLAHSVASITPGGTVATVAGWNGYPGPLDGDGTASRFNTPWSISYAAGALYVADRGNHTVRKISSVGGTNTVSTFAGVANAAAFVNNSTGYMARFDSPAGIAYYPGSPASGFAYVADTNNNAIRRVGLDGSVTTLAGGSYGYSNLSGTSAQFKHPHGLALHWGNYGVYVADTDNHCIRFVSTGGVPSLIAGQAGASGNANGDRLTTASFNAPRAVATSYDGNALYVADSGNYLVRKVDLLTGLVSTLAGSGSFGWTDANGTSASFGVLTGITADSAGNVYVAESQSGTIRKITSARDVTTLAGSGTMGDALDGTGTAARFGYPGPTDISLWGSGSPALVADPHAYLLRTVTPDTGIVTTVAGKKNVFGTSPGSGTFARFFSPSNVSNMITSAVVIDGNTIRYGGPEISDRATVSPVNALVGTTVQLDMSPQTATSWSWTMIRRPVGSTATLSSGVIRNPTFVPDVPDLYVFRCTAASASGKSISTVSLWANGAATHFVVDTGYPAPQQVGTFPVTVYPQDADNNPAYGYRGQVHFTSTLPTATLPADYTFIPADDSTASHAFNVTVTKSGSITFTVTDTSSASIQGTGFQWVQPGQATSLSLSAPTAAGSGVPFNVTVIGVDAYANTGAWYQGTVQFMSSDGTATLPSNYTFNGWANHIFTNGVTLRVLGNQTLTVADVTGSMSATKTIAVTTPPATPTGLSATGLSASQASLSWSAASGADHYEIYRAEGWIDWYGAASVPFNFIASTTQLTYTDSALDADSAYIYKLRAINAAGAPSNFGAPDPATTVIFTDEPLSAGVLVKGTHLGDLRYAVNSLRAAAGLTPISVVYSIPAGTTLVRGTDIEELRNAINDVRRALGLPLQSFTDATLTPGVTAVRAVHFQEIREAVK